MLSSSLGVKVLLSLLSLFVGMCIGCGGLASVLAVGQRIQTANAKTVNVIESNPNYTSAGLGLSPQEWGQRYGASQGTDAGHSSFMNGSYVMREPWDAPYLTWVQRIYRAPESVSLETARKDIARMSPADAVLIDAKPSEMGTVTETYRSETLKRRLPANTWDGTDAGSFIVVYRLSDGQVGGFVITTDAAYPKPLD